MLKKDLLYVQNPYKVILFWKTGFVSVSKNVSRVTFLKLARKKAHRKTVKIKKNMKFFFFAFLSAFVSALHNTTLSLRCKLQIIGITNTCI